ncbi:hypothetical protein SAMN04489713_111343 [Actinomadura madurae]|uniref:Uncharacterized protein n=1 Tax=Actinomadura madurae TaxID=1993 RepID=A0A1I5MMG7_9ACTN|nr:hypothetical protein SAMN04489713_111343 [Actinomadura madurae]
MTGAPDRRGAGGGQAGVLAASTAYCNRWRSVVSSVTER